MSRSKKRLTMSSRRWEELESEEIKPWLPDEIMYSIMCKLTSFPIYLARFSAVCKHWHRLVYNSWPKLVQEHRITRPLVFLPLFGREKSKATHRIYNFTGNYAEIEKHAHAPEHSLPCDSRAQIIGSSFGWLIIASNRKKNWSVSLFNPLSKSHIRLPVLERHSLCKGVLSKPPPRPEEKDQHFDIAITMFRDDCRAYYVTNKIAFLRVEMSDLKSDLWRITKQWVYHYYVEDPILDVSRIGAKICTLHISGIITCYSYRFSNVIMARWPWSILDDGYDSDGDHNATAHLLESSSSELLVVFRYEDCKNRRCSCKRTVGIKILTLNTSSDKKPHLSVSNWSEIKTLGNDAVFLSNGDGICIQAGSDVAAGSVYFINNKYYDVGQNCDTHFIQHVDVAELLQGWPPKRITRLIQHVDVADNIVDFLQGPPVWLMPSYDKMLKFSNIS